MDYSVLIVAAGKGDRMGLGYNKVFYLLKEGSTILDTTLELFLKDERCKQVVIVTNQSDLQKCVKKHEMGRIVHVAGGKTRQESVRSGLMAISEDVVLIHDGARPWCPRVCIDRLLEAMTSEQACILGVKVKDTIKEIRDGYIVRTIDREVLVQAQTPQAFSTKLILDCYRKAEENNLVATDDAQLVESMSDAKVRVVEGSYANIKITTKEDLR